MNLSKPVRLGVLGVGLMGKNHARQVASGAVPGCELAALCDPNPRAGDDFPGVAFFDSPRALFASGAIDAALVATPHYQHTELGIAALKAGLHVLVEKPISVHKAEALQLLAAHRSKKQVFAAMFNQRTDPHYRKLRDLVRSGELGKIRRIHWTITDWFRSEAYYKHAGWRATWAGEGGGVLLNQCPHNLDLFQWIFGMPAQIRGFSQFGRYHDIEVEDDVTAYFQYPDGTTAVFIASTGEAPGSNRLEVVGERGQLVMENSTMRFLRNEVSMSEFSRTTSEKFAKPDVWEVKIPLPPDRGEQHLGILKNFTNAILNGEALIAPASEGIHSVELANAIILSSLENRTVDLPMPAARYAKHLAHLIKSSKKNRKK